MSDLIPEGVYKAKAEQIGIETTGTGKDYVSAEFGVEVDGDVRGVEWRGWLTEKAMKRTIESLRLMGWTGDDLYELARDGALDNEVNIDVRHETYKDKTTARVSFINPPDLDPAATEKNRADLAARFKKMAAATKPAKGKTKPSAPDPEDDIGF